MICVKKGNEGIHTGNKLNSLKVYTSAHYFCMKKDPNILHMLNWKKTTLTHTLIEDKSLWSEYAMSLETWIKLAMRRPYKRSWSLPPCNIGKRLMKQADLYNTPLDLLSIENSKPHTSSQIKPNECNAH